eukprot:m.20695 g.20695  ORF g.20695 m.20695 type:complete len:65 (+) comp8187_c0_seq2:117-311(+)
MASSLLLFMVCEVALLTLLTSPALGKSPKNTRCDFLYDSRRLNDNALLTQEKKQMYVLHHQERK